MTLVQRHQQRWTLNNKPVRSVDSGQKQEWLRYNVTQNP
jgi:hypothetical protein